MDTTNKPTITTASGEAVQKNKKKPPTCREFRIHGSCKKGNDCKYRHVQKNQISFSGPATIRQDKKDIPVKPDVKQPPLTDAQTAAKCVVPQVKPATSCTSKSVDNPDIPAKPTSTEKPKTARNRKRNNKSKNSVDPDIGKKSKNLTTPKTAAPTKPAESASPASSNSSLASSTASSTSTATTAVTARSLTAAFPLKHWDTNESPYIWAYENLKVTNKVKFLAPYIATSAVTAKLLAFGLGDRNSVTFDYFPALPGELRNKIWGYAIEGTPNNCVMKWDWDQSHWADSDASYQFGDGFKQISYPPALLHVNKEARSLAIQHYELTFGTYYRPAAVYFNYANDRVFINTKGFHQLRPIIKLMSEHDRHRITRLALPLRDAYQDFENFAKHISRLSYLKELDLLAGDSVKDERFAYNKKFPAKIQLVLSHQWRKRWQCRPEVLALGPPKVKIDVIDGIDAHFYGIDDLQWYACGSK